jgi:Colicin D
MTPRQQADFATTVVITGVGVEQTIVSAPRTLAGLRGLVRGKPSSASLSFNDTQVQSQMAQHGHEFGASGSPGSPSARIEYMSTLVDHVDATGTTRLPGTFRGQPAIHYVDPEYGLNVFTTPEGAFWGAWRLSPVQIENIILRGSL